MSWILLGAAVLVGMLLLLRVFITANPRVLARGLRIAAAGGGLAAVAGLIAAGRGNLVLAMGTVAAPFLVRWLRSRRRAGQGAAASPAGAVSQVETMFLRMVLDHTSGALTGEVLQGPLRGRPLASLDRGEVMALLSACRAGDPPSVPLLERWLSRTRPEWASAGPEDGAEQATRPPPGGAMGRDEALEVLGLEAGADEAAIRAAHRRLMQKIHPDHGGSSYLAAKINQARDELLRH